MGDMHTLPILSFAGEGKHFALRLTQYHGQPLLHRMNATLTADGQIAIPRELRDSAHLKPGDTLDIHLYKGTILLRKHEPLTAEQSAELLERSRAQPLPTPEDDASVAEAIREVRTPRR